MQDFAAQVYPWQQQVWNSLTTRFPNIGHGLLFYGKAGSGKEAFAQQFLAWILCYQRQAQGACGVCGSCQWLKSQTHPNYVYVSTDEENKKQNAQIKIEKIRDLLPFVQQTVEGWRVILIHPAEALNTASANALLKTLEEPGEQVVIIVLAEHYLKLPATIRSRLQHFALDRIEPAQAQAYLTTHLPHAGQQQQQLLMNLANHMPLQAVALAQSEWLGQRAEFLHDWQKLVTHKQMPLQMANKWNKALSFHDFSQMYEYLLADVIAFKLGQQCKNIDLDVSVLSQYYHLDDLFTLYSELQQNKQLLRQNVQTNLMIDQLCIRLMHA
jgi:DNA polymerase III subunit delta'